jgi:hypothetical protein
MDIIKDHFHNFIKNNPIETKILEYIQKKINFDKIKDFFKINFGFVIGNKTFIDRFWFISGIALGITIGFTVGYSIGYTFGYEIKKSN